MSVEIDRLLSALTRADAAVVEARRTAGGIRWQVTQAVATLLDKDPNDIELGGWECEESPTGKCVYDQREDPALDSCLYCGGPDERK